MSYCTSFNLTLRKCSYLHLFWSLSRSIRFFSKSHRNRNRNRNRKQQNPRGVLV